MADDPNRARNLLTKIKKAKRTRAKGRQRPNPPGKALGLRGLAPGRRRALPTPAKRSGGAGASYQTQPTSIRKVGSVAPATKGTTGKAPAGVGGPTKRPIAAGAAAASIRPVKSKLAGGANAAAPGRSHGLPLPPGLAKKAAGARSARAFAPGRNRKRS